MSPRTSHRPNAFPAPVVHLNNPNPTSDFPRRTNEPHNSSHVHRVRVRRPRRHVVPRASMLLAFHVIFVFSESDPWPHTGRESSTLSRKRGWEVGDGFMTTLRTSGASVIWILELKT